MLRRVTTVVTMLAIAVTTVACSGGSGELIIYSGRTQNLIEPVLESFAEATGISVAYRYGDSAELALLLEEEGEDTDVDVFLAQNPGAVAFLANQGRLAPLDDDVLALVDQRFRDDSGEWVGVTGRQRVLVHNTELVDDAELPESVFDLTGEQYRGRVAVAPTNGSFQDFVGAMRAAVGDDQTLAWLEGLVANDVQTYPNNNSIVDAVSRGEVPMGLVNHYYNYRFLAENPSLPSRNHLFPDGDLGALVIVSTASVVTGTDMPDEAQRLVEYLLSADAQQYFRDETFEYPLAAGLDADPELPSLTDQELPEVDLRALGEDLDGTLRLIQESGLGS